MQLKPVAEAAKRYERLSYRDPPPAPVDEAHRPYYEAKVYKLHELGFGLSRSLESITRELSAARARVFILTGRAGQGKTNLVCDFVENFLWKHNIPCAYTTGRRLSAIHAPELADAITRTIFQDETRTFSATAQLLSIHAQRVGKPFVLIIDGINEHHNLLDFADQLEQFIERLVQVPNLRLLLTCRSEFFHQRFGSIVRGHSEGERFLVESTEYRLEDEISERLLSGYFAFFGVDAAKISPSVVESLTRDVLMLRFFCEAYGSRGKSGDYAQPMIPAIYRDRIFQIYLKAKLGTADAFLRRITSTPVPVNPRSDLISVLEHVLSHMLSAWRFTDVPASVIPAHLHSALYALLDEELVLRHDTAGPSTSIFDSNSDRISFTFDEFRDYLLAQYLVDRIYARDRHAFEQYIARSNPEGTQTVEGLKRFLFYASRQQGNTAFWDFYSKHDWYKDVYDQEIFNIDVALLRPEDGEIVLEGLRAGGGRARSLAVALALHWDPSSWPLLNLDLLVSFVAAGDDSRHAEFVNATIKVGQHPRLSRDKTGTAEPASD